MKKRAGGKKMVEVSINFQLVWFITVAYARRFLFVSLSNNVNHR